jgi:hypothetical protein
MLLPTLPRKVSLSSADLAEPGATPATEAISATDLPRPGAAASRR